MTSNAARLWLEHSLKSAGIESATAEARWMLERLFSLTGLHYHNLRQGSPDSSVFPQSDLRPVSSFLYTQVVLDAEQETLLRGWLERRINREPLQYILGVAPFYALELKVNPNVLIPRPETERLTELVLEHVFKISHAKILDVGTDISRAALEVAKQNAKKYDLNIKFFKSDLLQNSSVQTFAKTCDVLVANLPYLPQSDKQTVSPEVRHDPDLALYAGEDGLDIFRRLEQEAFEVVGANTLCFFELDPRNIDTAFDICRRWKTRLVQGDLTQRRRFLKLRKI
jgi:release factor glutamine methyltransferase